MPRLCIFDLDGTLLDTLTSLWYCSNESLRKEGLLPLPKDSFRYYVGDGARTQVERYLKDTDIGPERSKMMDDLHDGALSHDPHNPDDFEYYYESYMHELSQHADYEVRPYDGIPELLAELKKRDIRLAVYSNKPDPAAVQVIHKFFGEGTFDMVLGKREEFPKKPDPAGARYIMQQLGCAPAETLYFGDTDTDMQTGKNAGLFTFGVLWGFRDRRELEENGADVILAHPEEVLAYL